MNCIHVITALILLSGVPVLVAGNPEEQFVARMRDATLTGTWVPLQKGGLGAEKPDAYHVVRATRVEGERWEIVWRVSHQGRQVEYPLACTVQFAGDTAVLILDDAPVGEGKVYSARVMFHEEVYTGRWWGGGGEGGLISGTISNKVAP